MCVCVCVCVHVYIHVASWYFGGFLTVNVSFFGGVGTVGLEHYKLIIIRRLDENIISQLV